MNTEEKAAREYFQSQIRVDMAGQIAEAQHLGRRVRVGMYSDNCNAVDLAFHLCGGRNDTAQAMLDWLYLDTRDRLTAPAVWPSVEALGGSVAGSPDAGNPCRAIMHSVSDWPGHSMTPRQVLITISFPRSQATSRFCRPGPAWD